MTPVRLSDLAETLGINISTVSRALRNDPRVHEDTRRRVIAEAERLGYRPNLAARNLAEGRSRVVWFVLPGLDSPIEREPAAHASDRLLDRGYDLLLAQYHDRADVYARILGRLAHGGADAAIIIPGRFDGTAERMLQARRIPFVYLDRSIAAVATPVVTTDNFRASQDLFGRLLDRDDPAHVLVVDAFDRPPPNPVEAERQRGLADAVRNKGLRCLPLADFLASPAAALGGGVHRVLVLGTSQERVQAGCNALAAGGTGVPCGLGVFDHWFGVVPSGARVVVAVQDFRGMAERAVDLVLGMIRDGGSPAAGSADRVIQVPVLDLVNLP